MVTIGIDPGLGGAVALLDRSGGVTVYDTPTMTLAKGRDYLIDEMVEIFSPLQSGRVMVGLEKVHAMPKQGVSSMFTFGRGYGIWLGILSALGFPHELITPQRWQKEMLSGMPRGKNTAVQVARRMFPNADIPVSKHGRADALLIAEYVRRTAA